MDKASKTTVVWGVTRYEAIDRSGVAIFDRTVGCSTVSFTGIDRASGHTVDADISVDDAGEWIRILERQVAAGTWTKTTIHG